MESVFEYPLTIVESHLDTFGHMNNATYLQVFEEARWELITHRGFGLKEIQEQQKGPTILAIDIQFHREVKNREKVVIRTRCLNYSKRTGTVEQVMVNAKGEPCCTAKFIFGLFDIKERKLIPPTPEWLHAIGFTGQGSPQ